MTFKPNAVKRTVTGTFQRPDGVPSEGKIYMQMSNTVLGRQESVVYTGQSIEIELDENGSFTEDLAVTMPGLTVEEIEELNDVQSQRVQNLDDLADIQESINAYLEKLSGNLAVTEQETEQYNEDLETKKDLQVVSIELSKEYQKILDKQKNLEDTEVRMRVRFDFKNPKNTSKIEFIIPQGDGPVDIADLPRV